MASVSEVVNACCSGLDVHKDSVVACVRVTGPGGKVTQEVRSFATTTKGLLEFDERIEAVMTPLEHKAVETIDAIPGFDKRAAQNVLAEIDTDMNRFPTEGHLASWAGLCPGNHQSAGKRKSGRMTEGNKWLKRTLNQTAWAGSRTKASYFRAQFQRLLKRRGAKRAAMAVAHSQLGVIYQLLKHDKAFIDLGVDYFEKQNTESTKRRLVNKLERLGYKVTVESHAA